MGIKNGLRKWKLFNKTLTVVNGLLLCSTGYSTQYCVETYMGKKKKKSKGKKTDVSIGITDSFYCAPETVHCKLTMLLNKIKIKKM